MQLTQLWLRQQRLRTRLLLANGGPRSTATLSKATLRRALSQRYVSACVSHGITLNYGGGRAHACLL